MRIAKDSDFNQFCFDLESVATNENVLWRENAKFSYLKKIMNKSNEIKIMLKNCPHREKQREKETDQNVESEVVFGVVC